MDPQLKSLMTSVLLAGATAFTTWAVAHGLASPDSAAAIQNGLVALAGGLITAGIGWWKARAGSQKAMIQAVNKADNGVKVVPVETPGQVVNGPLK